MPVTIGSAESVAEKGPIGSPAYLPRRTAPRTRV